MIPIAAPSPPFLPGEGRIAGIDFGTVRIGLAVCDPSQRWVTPVATYPRRGEKKDAEFFTKLANDEQIVGWVVGLPLHLSGKESQKSTEVRLFASWLTGVTHLPVTLFDERFTTAEARRLLNETDMSPQKKKKRLDGFAAHLILTHFLERRGLEGDSGNGTGLHHDPSASSVSQPLDDGSDDRSLDS
jgi:putative Holliday junction resolvase